MLYLAGGRWSRVEGGEGWKVEKGGRWRRVVSLFRTNSSSAFSELGGHGNPNIDFAEMKIAQNAGH